MNLSREEIKSRLNNNRHQDPSQPSPAVRPGDPTPTYEPAAVLLPLYADGGEWHLVFIKRTEHDQDDHSGQIAFPGGRAEAGDRTLTATALRETKEEIGLYPRDVDILGFSKDITTVTHFVVTPIVGTFPWPYPLQPYPLEVEKIISMPLAWLADPHNHRVERWSPDEDDIDPYPVIFFEPYQGEVLWGATAKIVLDFVDLLQKEP